MQPYSQVIDAVRRAEFKRAPQADKRVRVDSRYLLLKNADKLSEPQAERLEDLLALNGALNAVYALKEQLQQLWHVPASVAHTGRRLDRWCELAQATGLAPMKRFVAMLQRHRTGICNYAEHPITTARLEGGHVAIGLIRKRAGAARYPPLQTQNPPERDARVTARPVRPDRITGSNHFTRALYLKGVSTNDFDEALQALFGESVKGLSASTISRLKVGWENEYERFRERDWRGHEMVYLWADGIVRHEALCDRAG